MLLSQPMDEIGCLFARHAFSPFGISAQGQVEPALRRVATELAHCENIDNHRAQSLLSLDRTCALPANPPYPLVLVFAVASITLTNQIGTLACREQWCQYV